MAERFREPFVNPYIDEAADNARFSTIVTMDEAHERWKKGAWRANETDFDLSKLSDSDEDESHRVKVRPVGVPEAGDEKENRFRFSLKDDIIYADRFYSNLDDTAYTDSYRPRGDIGSNISNITVDRLRYNALADIQEELPEDLSYLYGTSRDKRIQRQGSAKDRLYNRLDTPIDKRRAKVDQMLPEKRGETPEMIMADIRKRREIEDAKSGIVRGPRVKKSTGIYDTPPEPGTVEEFTYYDGQEEYDLERVTGRGSWRSEIPVQDGLVPDSKTMPYFGRFSRSWSKMDSLTPTRTEMLRHTVNTIYDDDASENTGHRKFRANGTSRREHYVSDLDFDPDDRYRRLSRQRKRLSASKNVLTESILSGEFNNPYVTVSDERLKSIINHDMRGPGQSAEPEGLTDPALLYEWNMGYSRVNTDENKYAAWLKEQSRLAEQAEQSRYRGSHRTGRPGAYLQREKPYGEERRYPRGERREREVRRRDMQEQMQRATERGIADGQEIIRRRQEAERRAEQERLRVLREQQEKQREQQRVAYQKQQEYYRKQQEQMLRQQQEYYQQQQAYMKRQQAQNGAQNNARSNNPTVGYPQMNPQQARQGYFPQMSGAQMNPQQARQGYFPQMSGAQMNPQQARQQGYYPPINPQAAAAQGGRDNGSGGNGRR